MGEAKHFERGTNWRAKNTNAIKLDTKGKKHPVRSVHGEAPSPEVQAEMEARRLAERRRLETEKADAKKRAERESQARKADAEHAEKDHTPAGWAERKMGPRTPKQVRIAAAVARSKKAGKRAPGK
ncbi:MAG: hypothetical protein ACTMIY_10740 [Microbacterium gubbeenense]